MKHGDTVLVKCKVEAIFNKSGMVMVTTRDYDKGFDAYDDKVVGVIPDNATNGDVIKTIIPMEDCYSDKEAIDFYHFIEWNFSKWWNSPYKRGETE